MTQYRPQEGERLDTIVFKAYGSIDAEVMVSVMDANEQLLDRTILRAGDIVYLPDIEKSAAVSESKALWS